MNCQKCGKTPWQAIKVGFMNQEKCSDGRKHEFRFERPSSRDLMKEARASLSFLVVLAASVGIPSLIVHYLLHQDARAAAVGIMIWWILLFTIQMIMKLDITVKRAERGL